MRKKTVKNLCDQIFWYIIYTLPVILTICSCLGAFQGDWFNLWFEDDGDYTNMPFINLLRSILENMGFFSDMWLVTILEDVFSMANISPYDTTIFQFMSYFITTVILHVFVDFILFIPRLAHKWMNKFCKED